MPERVLFYPFPFRLDYSIMEVIENLGNIKPGHKSGEFGSVWFLLYMFFFIFIQLQLLAITGLLYSR